MARLTAFSRQVQLFNDELNGEFRRRALVGLARASLAEAEAHNTAVLGRTPAHQTIVDGKPGASEEAVKPGGVIVYLFDVGTLALEQAVDEAYRLLIETSPWLEKRPNANPPTHYRDQHLMLVNGRMVEPPVELKETDEVEFVNMQPYARKIERGWSSQAPNGVYEVVAGLLRAKFGSILQIGFTYRGFIGASSGAGLLENPAMDPTRRTGARARGRRGRFADMGGPKAYNRSSQRWPVITLKLK